jgi:hypothetical protein
MVWTDSWTGTTIGYAASPDLVHWSAQKAIAVMAAEQTTLNTWAPEVHFDAKNGRFILFWASTIPGRFTETQDTGDGKYNHRIYCTTTKDFQTFSPTRLYFDPGFEVIDATLLRSGGRFCLIFKDETLRPLRKNLRLAWSDSIDGPFSDVSPAFTRQWVEGPTAVEIGGKAVVYFDCYRDHHYGAETSTDLTKWKDITSQIVFPRGARHGTVIAVPRSVLASLAAAEPAPTIGALDAGK